MLARTLGLSAALALAVNGVLIPPNLALNVEAEDQVDQLQTFPNSLNVALECARCSYAEPEGDVMVWKEGVDNSLVYQFDVGSQKDRLAFNGVQLYPPVFGEPEPIYIHQVPHDGRPKEFLESHPDHRGLRITQMEFVFNTAETINENGNELLMMHLKVSGIAGQSIPPQVLQVFVIKDKSGQLHIATVKNIADPAAIKADEAEQCAKWPMLCNWRQALADKLSKFRNSMKKPGKGCQKAHPKIIDGEERHHHRPGRPGHHSKPNHKPHPHHPHHRHHRHNKFHHALHMLMRVVITFVIPILVGLTVGVITYGVGMLIGLAVAVVVMKIRGVCRGQYTSVALDEDEEDLPAKSGKEAYIAEDIAEVEGEAPPVYQEKEVV